MYITYPLECNIADLQILRGWFRRYFTLSKVKHERIVYPARLSHQRRKILPLKSTVNYIIIVVTNSNCDP